MATLADLLVGIICPRCEHEDTYVIREVEDIVPVDGNTVSVTITVGECSFCGERLLDPVATRKVDEAVRKVRQGALGELTTTGTAYHYP